jgi:hypothetical protein
MQRNCIKKQGGLKMQQSLATSYATQSATCLRLVPAALAGLLLATAAWAQGQPNKLVFQRGAGSSSQTVSYWAGSALPEGGGGPVPNFANPPQPAWADVELGGSHTIEYAGKQPIGLQDIFFSILLDGDKTNPVCTVSAKLHGDGAVTNATSNCPTASQIVVATYGDHVAVMMPPEIPAVPQTAAKPHQLVFQRGAGGSSQAIAYWAGSTKDGKGGPVPNFLNAPQPAWIDLMPGGSHTIVYAGEQPTDVQTVFFKIIVDNAKDRPACTVSAQLQGNGKLTDAKSDCPKSIVLKTNAESVAVMLPPQL